MSEGYGEGVEPAGELRIDKREFELGGMEDDLRVDRLVKDLLYRFYFKLQEGGLSPVEASSLASGADYFLRSFVIDIKQRNIFEERPGMVRQFAGNWHIVNTLEPDIKELNGYLEGIRAFYRFLHASNLISGKYLKTVEKECDDKAYYEGRIDSFWDIKGDGYLAWERECTLKDE